LIFIFYSLVVGYIPTKHNEVVRRKNPRSRLIQPHYTRPHNPYSVGHDSKGLSSSPGSSSALNFFPSR